MIINTGSNPCRECPEREPGRPCRLREECRTLKHYRFKKALRKCQIRRQQEVEDDVIVRLLRDRPHSKAQMRRKKK